jgi:hypothetical protein
MEMGKAKMRWKPAVGAVKRVGARVVNTRGVWGVGLTVAAPLKPFLFT